MKAAYRSLLLQSAAHPVDSVTRARDEGKLPAVVENIVDLNEFFAIIFDKTNIAVTPSAINLHRNLRRHMIQEMLVVINHLAVHVHINSTRFLGICIR